jgi:hypothetical protein
VRSVLDKQIRITTSINDFFNSQNFVRGKTGVSVTVRADRGSMYDLKMAWTEKRQSLFGEKVMTWFNCGKEKYLTGEIEKIKNEHMKERHKNKAGIKETMLCYPAQ